MSQLKILIIDDNHDLADGLGMVLEDEGYKVTIVYNGIDGIKAFEKEDFDVVFLDVKLPDINGVEVFQNIHKIKPMVNVIMMTGYRVEQMLAEVVDDGDVEVLRKPPEVGHVLEMLDKARKESIILIADDTPPDFADGLAEFISDHGMKAMAASNGKEAVDGVLSNSVEVLVLDLRMPIMCGLEVYLELKERGNAVKTIIVIGCPEEESEVIDILKSTSVTGCLFKPFKPEDMLYAIEQIIER